MDRVLEDWIRISCRQGAEVNFPCIHAVELAYAESFHFVLFLFEEYGERAFAKMISRLREGDSFQTAFATAYGRSFGPMEKQWRDDLSVAFTWIPVLTGSSAVWFFATPPQHHFYGVANFRYFVCVFRFDFA